MIAKLIAHAPTRDKALDKLAGALEQSVVIGPRNNVGFLAALARAREFRSGRFDTGFIDQHLSDLVPSTKEVDRGAVALAADALLERERAAGASMREPDEPPSPWDTADAFQLSGKRLTTLSLAADGEPVTAEIAYTPRGLSVSVGGEGPARDARLVETSEGLYVLRHGRTVKVSRRDLAVADAETEASGLVRAPMHGKVLAVFVDEGAQVVRGQRLAIIEAMKMEHTLTAPVDGTVAELSVTANSQVAENAKLMLIRPEDDKRQ